jgi:tetratricopeptide (TPR) repeat protein
MVFKLEKDSRSSKSSSSVDKVASDPKYATQSNAIPSTTSETAIVSGLQSQLEESRQTTDGDAVIQKPFFIMDWLEQVDQADLERAQRMLKTPKRESRSNSQNFLSDVVVPTSLFASESSQSSRSGSNEQGLSPTSFFRRRSISMGVGWNAKGLAKAKNGLWEDALACWENALAIRVQILGEDHIDVANTYNNMGIAYGKLDQPSQAISALQMALEIRIKEHGEKHCEVAATLHNMGNILQQSGDLEASIEYFTRAKDVQESMFTHQHVQVARACVAMGHAFFQGKHYEKSHEAFCEALVIFERLRDGEDLASEIEATRNEIQDIEELMYPSGN